MRLLFLTTPPMRGQDVLEVQGELRRHGFAPGPLDGIYGEATAAAVRRCQRAAGLRVDGVVGPATRQVLGSATRPKPPPPLPGREPPGLQALAWLAHRLGEKEHPAGTNRCPVTAEFGLVGPWCMMAVSLAFKHGANLILGDDAPHPWGFWAGRGFAYCPAFEAWAKSRGYWIGRTTPRRGDVALYSFGHPEAVHVGIVEQPLAGAQFDAVEGNTSVGNESNGGQVLKRHRYISQVRGFARVTRKRT